MNTDKSAAGGVVEILDAEIASLPVMAEMATQNGVRCDATDAVARLTQARATVAELAAAARDKLDDPGYSALVTDAVDARLRAALSNIEGGKT